jgi:hypothetical protein
MNEENNQSEDYALFRKALDIYATQHISNDDQSYCRLVEDGHGTDHLYDIDKFVKGIERASDIKINEILNAKGKIEKKNHPLTKRYDNTSRLSLGLDSDCIYSPHVELFWHAVCKLKPDLSSRKEPDTVIDFKEIVKEIRRIVKTEKFKKKARGRKENLDAGRKSTSKYIERLFEMHSRLLVVRIDFHLKMAKVSRIEQLRSIRRALSQFLNNSRNRKYLKDAVGYVWKFEQGGTLGGHYHFIFFFNGANFQKDEFIGWEIGKFWQKTTNGLGTFFNVNSKAYLDEKFPNGKGVGVGRINSSDSEKRESLSKIIDYLFKIEQYLGARDKECFRIFGRGVIKHRKGIGGRPRKLVE